MSVPVNIEIKRLRSFVCSAVKTKVFLDGIEITQLRIGQGDSLQISAGEHELVFQSRAGKTVPLKICVQPDSCLQIEFRYVAINLFHKEILLCLAVSGVFYLLFSKHRFCILGCHHLFLEMLLFGMLLIYPFMYALYAYYKNPMEFKNQVKIRAGLEAPIQVVLQGFENWPPFTKNQFICCVIFILLLPVFMVGYIKFFPYIYCWFVQIFGAVCHKGIYW